MFKKLFKFGKKKEEIKNDEVLDEEVVSKEEIHTEVDEEKTKDEEHETLDIKDNELDEETKEIIKEELFESKTVEVKEELDNIKENENIQTEEVKQNVHIDESNNTEEINLESVNEETSSENISEEKATNETNKDSLEESIISEAKTQEDYSKEEDEIVEESQKKVNLFERLKQGLTKAKQGITDKIDDVLKSYTKVDEDLLEELEEILITADVGVNTTMEIIDKLRDKIKENKITEPQDVKKELKNIVEDILTNENTILNVEKSPTIILMVGVNGVGKTTTIGKLANRYRQEGKKVLLAAGDTFRAAAIEQLEVWASRSNVDIIKHQEGADPGAVVFDAIKAAKARNVDLLICDTAGRLHNKANLMNELGKVFKIVDREFPEANKEVLLVVDATTGQNAVVQAKTFKEVADITGIVLTKLDGTAKGGVVLAVKSEVDVPVKLIGVGEKVEDLQDFNAKAFSDALFGSN